MATASDKQQQRVQPNTCSQDASSLQQQSELCFLAAVVQAVPRYITDTLIASSWEELLKPIHK